MTADSTSVSLLQRLHRPDDHLAWARFVDLYTPMLFEWARRSGLTEADAADLIQDVFELLLRKLPEFVYDGQRSFRGWLRTVLLNQWRTQLRRRRGTRLDANDERLAEPGGQMDLVEAEYREHLIRRALQIMQTDFQPATWQACWEHVARGRPAAEVAAELGITVKAVYLAKARVLRRLRQELDGLWN
jgi:RNA polymerase sigma-70 factor (ECF subfamily)